MMPDHVDYLVRKISAFVDLSAQDMSDLSDLQSTPIEVKKGREIVHEGQAGQSAYIIHDGWACRFKLLSDGGRQIITFPIPGDCVGLRSILLRTSDHSFSALTDTVVSRIQAVRMRELFQDVPRLGAAILWAASRDEAMVVEHLVSIGRRSAMERTAHLLLELYDRLHIVGLADNGSFACPLSQNVLADALGLSTIHVNRVLRQLRERGLVTVKNQTVVIEDMPATKILAGYVNRDNGAFPG
jgi:CRP-like cAMP-binding protein